MRQKEYGCNLAGAFSLVAKLAAELQTRESVGEEAEAERQATKITGSSGELGAAGVP